jgi:REP element-mobilizing transposase RayT
MSGDRYKIAEPNGIYYLTLTVVDWVDIFTRKEYQYAIVDSLNYCIANKGLVIHGWCLMSNHLHLIAKANENFNLSDILRDFKKYTSKTIINLIKEIPESRREWLLHRFEYAGKYLKRIKNYKFWKDDNHAILLDSTILMEQKLEYMHNNPVVAEIVNLPYEYIYSSAKFYADEPCLIKCERL